MTTAMKLVYCGCCRRPTEHSLEKKDEGNGYLITYLRCKTCGQEIDHVILKVR